jgi:hypothetical protein
MLPDPPIACVTKVWAIYPKNTSYLLRIDSSAQNAALCVLVLQDPLHWPRTPQPYPIPSRVGCTGGCDWLLRAQEPDEAGLVAAKQPLVFSVAFISFDSRPP